MSEVKTKLTKVLNDLLGNRKNLVGQIDAQTQQLEVNQSQLEHFDVVIASIKKDLADESGKAVTEIEDLLLHPSLLDVPPAPLAAAGDAGDVAGQAPAESDSGTDANGSPV